MKLKSVLLALALLCIGPATAQIGAPNQILCNQLAFQTASSASTATLLAGVSGRTIYVCGWHVTSSSASASTFQFFQGTGTNCGTAATALTPAYNVTSTAPATDHIEFAGISLPSGNNLCIISSGTSLQPSVWVGQY